MCWAQKAKSFLVQNVRFSPQLAAPWILPTWAAAVLVPTPNTYATGCIGCISPLFSLAVVHGFRLRHYIFMQDGAAIQSVRCPTVEAQIPSRCRVWHVFCHKRPASISLLLFLGVATTSKEFQWYLAHDVTTVSLRLVFFSFRCKLRPHFHLGFYALQSR